MNDDPPTGSELTREFIEEMKDVFSLFDEDSTGSMPTQSLGAALRALNKFITQNQLDDLINEADAAGTGEVDFAAFYALFVNHNLPEAPSESEIVGFFDVYDRAGDGFVDAAEFKEMLLTMGEPLTAEDAEHLLREVEIDGDRRINVLQFVEHMLQTSTAEVQ